MKKLPKNKLYEQAMKYARKLLLECENSDATLFALCKAYLKGNVEGRKEAIENLEKSLKNVPGT